MNIDTMFLTIGLDGNKGLCGNIICERDINGYLCMGFVYKNLVFIDKYNVMRLFGFTEFDEYGNETVHYKLFHKEFNSALNSLGIDEKEYPTFGKSEFEVNPYAKNLPTHISELVLFEMVKNNQNLDKAVIDNINHIIINMKVRAIDRAKKLKEESTFQNPECTL